MDCRLLAVVSNVARAHNLSTTLRAAATTGRRCTIRSALMGSIAGSAQGSAAAGRVEDAGASIHARHTIQLIELLGLALQLIRCGA